LSGQIGNRRIKRGGERKVVKERETVLEQKKGLGTGS